MAGSLINKTSRYLFILCLVFSTAAAQNLSYGVAGNGFVRTETEKYQMMGTLGQYVIGSSAGDLYSMESGFWYITSPTATRVETDAVDVIPKDFHLYQNYPNPFNPSTAIEYALPSNSWVEIAIFNLLGRRVRLLADAHKNAGIHRVMWDGMDDRDLKATSGVYFCILRSGDVTLTRKLILIK